MLTQEDVDRIKLEALIATNGTRGINITEAFTTGNGVLIFVAKKPGEQTRAIRDLLGGERMLVFGCASSIRGDASDAMAHIRAVSANVQSSSMRQAFRYNHLDGGHSWVCINLREAGTSSVTIHLREGPVDPVLHLAYRVSQEFGRIYIGWRECFLEVKPQDSIAAIRANLAGTPPVAESTDWSEFCNGLEARLKAALSILEITRDGRLPEDVSFAGNAIVFSGTKVADTVTVSL